MYVCCMHVCACLYLFILGKIYEQLLQKPPELTDALDLLRSISPSWYDIGSKLLVPSDFRDSLTRDSLSNEAKLDKILNAWINGETADVTWRTILKALQALDRRDVSKKTLDYLQRPEIYSKYIKKKDFTPCPDFS